MEIGLIIAFTFLNFLSFYLFRKDKMKAKKGQIRISEFSLCLVTLLGGTFGAITAMKIYRHKTRKLSFILRIILIILIQLAICWFILSNNVR